MNDQAITNDGTYAKALATKEVTADNLFTRSGWNPWIASTALRVVDPASLTLPSREGDVLVYTGINTEPTGADIAGFKITVTRTAEAWTSTREPLPFVTIEPTAAVKAAKEAFGGAIVGFSRVERSGGGGLYIAHSPGPKAARYLWRDERGQNAHRTFADVVKAHPEAGELPFLKTIANTVLRGSDFAGHTVIDDPASWRKTYDEKGYRTRTFRHYDKGERPKTVTEYTITGAITTPQILGEQLQVTTFGKNQQPHRVVFGLDRVGQADAVQVESLVEGTVILDERVGPERVEPPLPGRR